MLTFAITNTTILNLMRTLSNLKPGAAGFDSNSGDSNWSATSDSTSDSTGDSNSTSNSFAATSSDSAATNSFVATSSDSAATSDSTEPYSAV